MPRKQRTAIKGSDPKYHSNLPRKSDQTLQPALEPIASEAAPRKIASDSGPKRRDKPVAPAPRPKATPKPKTKPQVTASPAPSDASSSDFREEATTPSPEPKKSRRRSTHTVPRAT